MNSNRIHPTKSDSKLLLFEDFKVEEQNFALEISLIQLM